MYCYVWQPRANKDPTKPSKYGVMIVWPKSTDLSALKKAATAAARKKWGDKIPGALRSPFRDADAEHLKRLEMDPGAVQDPNLKGTIYINARSGDRPGVVDRMVHPIVDQMAFYSGCIANVTLNAFGYDTDGNRGVSFALGNIQKVADGPRLTGQRPADEDFEELPPDANTPGTTADSDNLF